LRRRIAARRKKKRSRMKRRAHIVKAGKQKLLDTLWEIEIWKLETGGNDKCGY
jgi:hypothetical protein